MPLSHVLESSRSPWPLESSDNVSSVELKEQVTVISLVATHKLKVIHYYLIAQRWDNVHVALLGKKKETHMKLHINGHTQIV